jgi:7-cyano-7-deazaguanine synthase in queuosine biosynthesis
VSGEILLYSAGLDSQPAWHYLGKPPAVYFDIRHKYRAQEIATVQELSQRCGIDLTVSREIDLSRWEPADDPIIPLRNIHLALHAAHRADVIWCVGVKGDHTHDKSPDAFRRISAFLSDFAGRPIRVDSPFWDMTKTDIVRWYLNEGLPLDDLLATFSCLSPGAAMVHCGACPSCLRRWIALANNGLTGTFAANPWEWDRIQTYYLAAMRDGTYPAHRAEEFHAALATVGIHS